MRTNTSNNTQLGRNDKCHCGSGKKYKKCCMNTDYQNNNQSTTNQMTNTTTMNSERWEKLENVEVYSTLITSYNRFMEGSETPNWFYPDHIKNMSSDKVFETMMLCDIEYNGVREPSIVRIIHNTPIDTQQLQGDVFMREMGRLIESGRYNDFIKNDTIFHNLVGTEQQIILEEKNLKNHLIQNCKTDIETLTELEKQFNKVG